MKGLKANDALKGAPDYQVYKYYTPGEHDGTPFRNLRHWREPVRRLK